MPELASIVGEQESAAFMQTWGHISHEGRALVLLGLQFWFHSWIATATAGCCHGSHSHF